MTAMGNTEKTELTVMCMICDGTKILVQDRVNKDWPGVTFPGGHVEPGEAFTDAVRREVKEETGLDIFRPTVCGINDFIRDDGTRYIVLFFRADRFSGDSVSSGFVRSLIKKAHSKGIAVCAKEVDSPSDLTAIGGSEIDLIEGIFNGRPLRDHEFIERMSEGLGAG